MFVHVLFCFVVAAPSHIMNSLGSSLIAAETVGYSTPRPNFLWCLLSRLPSHPKVTIMLTFMAVLLGFSLWSNLIFPPKPFKYVSKHSHCIYLNMKCIQSHIVFFIPGFLIFNNDDASHDICLLISLPNIYYSLLYNQNILYMTTVVACL